MWTQSRTTKVTEAGKIPTVLPEVKNVKAVPIGMGVFLMWERADNDVEGYKILRSDSSFGEYVEIDNVPRHMQSYIDESVQAGRVYFYKIIAYKFDDESGSAKEIRVRTFLTMGAEETGKLNAPKNVRAEGKSVSSIKVSWEELDA